MATLTHPYPNLNPWQATGTLAELILAGTMLEATRDELYTTPYAGEYAVLTVDYQAQSDRLARQISAYTTDHPRKPY